jgi:hypothetical protein
LDQHITAVHDGRKALDYLLNKRSGSDFLAAIFLDLKLPKISGLQVLEAIRSDIRICHIPVFPMEMRFQNYLSMNLEPSARSVFLIANIALGNAIALGGDLRHLTPGLLDFCRNWIGFYRKHRRWLCGNLTILDPFTLAHRLPGEFLVFAFNADDQSRKMNIQFTLEQAGLKSNVFDVVEEYAVTRNSLGKVVVSHDKIFWKQTIPARDFSVLRFRPAKGRK